MIPKEGYVYCRVRTRALVSGAPRLEPIGPSKTISSFRCSDTISLLKFILSFHSTRQPLLELLTYLSVSWLILAKRTLFFKDAGGRSKGLTTVGAKKLSKTYNSGYSLVVTHLTTNPPVRCLNRAERTGSLVVSRSDTIKTAKLSVSSIAQPVASFCRKEKDLLALRTLLRAEQQIIPK